MIKRKITNIFIDDNEIAYGIKDLYISTDKVGEDLGIGDFVYSPPVIEIECSCDKSPDGKIDPHGFDVIDVYSLDEETRTKCDWCPETHVLYSSAPDLSIQFKDKTAKEMFQILLTNLDKIPVDPWQYY